MDDANPPTATRVRTVTRKRESKSLAILLYRSNRTLTVEEVRLRPHALVRRRDTGCVPLVNLLEDTLLLPPLSLSDMCNGRYRNFAYFLHLSLFIDIKVNDETWGRKALTESEVLFLHTKLSRHNLAKTEEKATCVFMRQRSSMNNLARNPSIAQYSQRPALNLSSEIPNENQLLITNHAKLSEKVE
jgi:hypothetical protein